MKQFKVGDISYRLKEQISKNPLNIKMKSTNEILSECLKDAVDELVEVRKLLTDFIGSGTIIKSVDDFHKYFYNKNIEIVTVLNHEFTGGIIILTKHQGSFFMLDEIRELLFKSNHENLLRKILKFTYTPYYAKIK